MRRLVLLVFIFGSFFLEAQVNEPGFLIKDQVLVKYRGNARDLVIPPKLGINRIGEKAFAQTTITSVVIPVGVGYIDERAFMGCSFLKAVTLPNTLISLGKRAFFNCFLLEKINLPRSLVAIEEGAFFNCQSLQEMDIPDSIKKLGSRAFSGCSGLQKLSISRRTQLGDNPFMGVRCEITYRD